MDLRTAISAQTSAAQANTPVTAGNIFERDGTVALVLHADPETVRWVTAAGDEQTAPRREFLARALERVVVGPPKADYLDSLWQLVSAREVPGSIRARVIQGAAARAKTDSERRTAQQWAALLLSGMEPTR